MHVSRSRLIAVGAVMLAVAGGVLAAGSFASGPARPSPTQRPPLLRALPKRPAVPAAPRKAATGSAQRTFVSAAAGNDANPCTRAAPCRNFAAAIAQTVSGGEVVVLDSGGYGTVTISQAVSLVAPPGVYAGISVFSGTGITINAGLGDVVTIRGLTLNGLGGGNGIVFTSGAALYVQDSVFKNLAGVGVYGAASASVVVEDSLFSRVGNGVFLQTGAGTIRGTVEHSRFEDGFAGVIAGIGANAVVRDSVASGNQAGFSAQAVNAQLDVENSLATHNDIGLNSNGVIRASETTIEENTTGLAGTIVSFGNNRLAGNGFNGSFTSTIPLK